MSIVSGPISAGWGKVKFFYATPTSMALTATSEESANPVSNMLNRLETNYYQSAVTTTQYITDTGSSNADVDYLVLCGTNLLTAGATITLQYSSDNFVADENDAFTGEIPASNSVYLKEFTQINSDYWRIKITGATVAPKITIGYWGELTELDWCSTGIDPNGQKNRDVVNRSEAGYVTGIYEVFTERFQRFVFNAAELDIYDKLELWFNAIGKQNFFTGWDTADHPTEIFLMYSDGNFINPYVTTGLYRDLSVNLTGRKV